MKYFKRRITRREMRHNGPVYIPIVEMFKTNDPNDIGWAQKGLRIPFEETDNFKVEQLLSPLKEDCIYIFKAAALD